MVRFSMLAEAVVLAALGISIVGLLCDAMSQRRLLRAIQAHVAAQDDRVSACETAAEAHSEQQRRLELRQDRLTNMVQERGWRDSMLLTRFDWRDPKDRG